MFGMFEIFDVSYDELKKTHSNELYRLRKKTFSDRLGWDVLCNQDMEFDEFDNSSTRYILGIYNGQLICSVRFIDLDKPNMITHTFRDCFDDIKIPVLGKESSRFFVDKARAKLLLGDKYPVSKALFLAMINWGMSHNLIGIHTIVSRAMFTILLRSGWKITRLKEAYLNADERIYLVFLPTSQESQLHMGASVSSSIGYQSLSTCTWPLSLPVLAG